MIASPFSRSTLARLLGRLAALGSVALLVACTQTQPSGAAPTVVIDAPVDGAVVSSSTVDVEGRVVRDARLTSMTVRNETTGVSFACTVSGSAFDCTAVSLASGQNRLVATATDDAGRTGRDAATVSYQPGGTAHLVILSPPSTGTTSTPSVDLHGAVSGFGGGLTVSVNTGALEGTCASGDGTFTCADVPLLEGDNLLVVTGNDDAGRSASDAVFVEYDPDLVDDDAPTVTIVEPVDGFATTEGTVEVEANVADDGLLTRVDAIVDGARTRCDYDGDTDVATCQVLLTESVQTIEVSAVDDGGRVGTDAVQVTFDPPTPAFDIDLAFFDESYTDTQTTAFEQAVAFWEAIVIGDLQDVTVDFTDGVDPQAGEDYACGQGEPAFDGTIDDLRVYVSSFEDGSTVLGVAGPCRSRTGGPDAGTNLVGYMEFNTTYLEQLEADGQLVETIVHELGHVLGFGTNWEFEPYFDLLAYEPSSGVDCSSVTTFDVPPVYLGEFGRLAYELLGGVGDVPVEEDGGPGTKCGHWDEETFGNELMTGFLNEGAPNPLSVLSAAAFLDLGLDVDLRQSETYEPPTELALRTQGLDLAGREILLRPLGGVDVRDGTVHPVTPAGTDR